jgi:poly-gamma-glutamate synthesis protein (capsule biosynthesis protein)
MHWGVEYAPAPRPEDVETAHKMLEAGASVIVGHHPHVLQPVETYRTADGRNAVIFYSLGNFLSNQSRSYVDDLMPDKEGDPRDSMIGLFSAIRKDSGPAGVRVEVGRVGILPVWGENNRNQLASGHAKMPLIQPVLIDREMPRLQAKLDALTPSSQGGAQLNVEQKQEFIDWSNQLKLLDDRRRLLLQRVGDEYVTDPPRLHP